jgi:hypothetical protein
MKWIVLEENPRPDNYIAIMAAEEDRKLQIEKKPCSIFDSCDKAMYRARELRQKYKVSSIRLFQQDGVSVTV